MDVNAQNATGIMTYVDRAGKTQSHYLWVRTITQQNALTGSTYQSKYSRHFYPRHFNLGNYNLGCITDSQEKYQATAKYIREYHLSLANTFVTTRQATLVSDSRQYVTLQIPSEQIHVFGIPERFQLIKKGVFDPAPIFAFEFIILYNYHRPTNYALSNEIRDWYQGTIQNAYNDPRSGLKT